MSEQRKAISVAVDRIFESKLPQRHTAGGGKIKVQVLLTRSQLSAFATQILQSEAEKKQP